MDKTIKIWDIKERLLIKSGEIKKDEFWTLIGLRSITCMQEKDKDVEGMRFK